MNEKITEREQAYTVVRRCLITAVLRAAAAAAALGIAFTFLFGIITVERNDMFPQVHAGDMTVFFRPGSFAKQDAVVYDSPDGPAAGRILACPGDIVDITDSGQITINGNIMPAQKRLGIYEETEKQEDGISYPAVLGEDEYFVLGDNRTEARDSRVYGCIDKEDIRGVIFLLIRRRMV